MVFPDERSTLGIISHLVSYTFYVAGDFIIGYRRRKYDNTRVFIESFQSLVVNDKNRLSTGKVFIYFHW